MTSDQHSPSASCQHPVMHFREPTLTEALSDPIVQAVMRADGVDRHELKAMLLSVVAHQVRRKQQSASYNCPPSGRQIGSSVAPHDRNGVV